MRQRIRRIAELIREEGAGCFGGEPRREGLIVVGVSARDIGARQHDLGAERAQVQNFFARHLVGNDQHDAVAFQRADERESEACVARRRLNDDAARTQRPARLRRLNH